MVNLNSSRHSGNFNSEQVLEPLDISVTEAAQNLSVTRQALSRLIHEKTGISAEMAIRLSKAFKTTLDYWMNLEMQHKLWQASKLAKHINVKPFKIDDAR